MSNFVIPVLVFCAGLLLVLATLNSAVQTFVVPRSQNTWLTRMVFHTVWRSFFGPAVRLVRTYERQDPILAVYAPAALLTLPVVWFACILLGYTGMFWAAGIRPWSEAFHVSGSSLLTLGFYPVESLPTIILAFTEATLGLGMMALLIAYLPTMYSAFSQREAVVTLLEAYAGVPPSPVELLARTHRIKMLHRLEAQWDRWETWFAQLEESHTSLFALVYFRSPQPERSWVTAAGVILDSAALTLSTVDTAYNPQAALCIRAGYLALRRIAEFFRIEYDPKPRPDDPISISKLEFDAAWDELAANGVPLKPDREQAWRDYAGWRVNYDAVLVALANLTVAPYARWTSDRPVAVNGRTAVTGK